MTSSVDLNLKKLELRSLRPFRNPEHSDSSSAKEIQASNSVEEAIAIESKVKQINPLDNDWELKREIQIKDYLHRITGSPMLPLESTEA